MIFRRALANAERVNRTLETLIDEYQATLDLSKELVQNADETLDLLDDARSSLGIINNLLGILNLARGRIGTSLRTIPRFGPAIAAAIQGIIASLRIVVRFLRVGITLVRPGVKRFKMAVEDLEPFVRVIDLQFQPINSAVNRTLWAARILASQQDIIEPPLPDSYKRRLTQILDQVEPYINRFGSLVVQLRDVNRQIRNLNTTISLLNVALRQASFSWRLAVSFAQLAVFLVQAVEALLGPLLDAIAAVGSALSQLFSPIQALINRLLAPLAPLQRKLMSLEQRLLNEINQFQTMVKKAFDDLVQPYLRAFQIYARVLRLILDQFLGRLIEIQRLIEQLLALLNPVAEWKDAIEFATPDNLKELERIIRDLIEELGLQDEEEGRGAVRVRKAARIAKLIDDARTVINNIEDQTLGKPLAPIKMEWLSRMSKLTHNVLDELGHLRRELPKQRRDQLSEGVASRAITRLQELRSELITIQSEITGLASKTKSRLPRGYRQDLRRYLNRASFFEPVDLLTAPKKRKSKERIPILELDRKKLMFRFNISPLDPLFDLTRPVLEAADFLPKDVFPPSLVKRTGSRIELRKGRGNRRRKR